MKVILRESHFKKLLNETKGVNETAIYLTNHVYGLLEPYVIEAVASMEKDEVDLDYDYQDLKKVYKNDLDSFIDFPVEELEIEFKFFPVNKKLVDDAPFDTGGGAYSIEDTEDSNSYMKEPSLELPKKMLKNIDYTIHGKLDFDVYVNIKKFEESMIDDLLNDLLDTITHEFNHLYEFYKRWDSTGSGKVMLTKSYAGTKNVNTPKKIFEIYENFLIYMYYSEPWEINANVQEAYSKIQRMNFNEFRQTKQWMIAELMENYSAEELYNELIKVTEERSPEAVDFHIKNLHKFYLKQYKGIAMELLQDEVKVLEDQVFKTKNLLELFKKYENRINKAGETLKRKFMRLFTIEKDGEE